MNRTTACRSLLLTAFVGGLWVTGAGVANAAETDDGATLLSGGSSIVDAQLSATLGADMTESVETIAPTVTGTLQRASLVETVGSELADTTQPVEDVLAPVVDVTPLPESQIEVGAVLPVSVSGTPVAVQADVTTGGSGVAVTANAGTPVSATADARGLTVEVQQPAKPVSHPAGSRADAPALGTASSGSPEARTVTPSSLSASAAAAPLPAEEVAPVAQSVVAVPVASGARLAVGEKMPDLSVSPAGADSSEVASASQAAASADGVDAVRADVPAFVFDSDPSRLDDLLVRTGMALPVGLVGLALLMLMVGGRLTFFSRRRGSMT